MLFNIISNHFVTESLASSPGCYGKSSPKGPTYQYPVATTKTMGWGVSQARRGYQRLLIQSEKVIRLGVGPVTHGGMSEGSIALVQVLANFFYKGPESK